MHHVLHGQFKCLDVYSIDPRDVIQSSLQDPWECNSSIALSSMVGGDIAFITSSSHQLDASVVTYVTHTDATDRLRACFENLDITSMSKVLLVPWLFVSADYVGGSTRSHDLSKFPRKRSTN